MATTSNVLLHTKLHLHAGKENEFYDLIALMLAGSVGDEGSIFFRFAFGADSTVVCREAYRDGQCVVGHLAKAATSLQNAFKISDLKFLLASGSAVELNKCRSAVEPLHGGLFELKGGYCENRCMPSHCSIVQVVEAVDENKADELVQLFGRLDENAKKSGLSYSYVSQHRNKVMFNQGFSSSEDVTATHLEMIKTILGDAKNYGKVEEGLFIGTSSEWNKVKEALEACYLSFFEIRDPPAASLEDIEHVRSQMQEYADSKGIPDLLAEMIHAMLIARPNEPYEYMESWLADKEKQQGA